MTLTIVAAIVLFTVAASHWCGPYHDEGHDDIEGLRKGHNGEPAPSFNHT